VQLSLLLLLAGPPGPREPGASTPKGTEQASAAALFAATLSLDLVPASGTALGRATRRQYRAGNRWIEEVSGPEFQAVLQVVPQDDRTVLSVDIIYLEATTVGHEAIALRLPGRGMALGRDLQIAALDRPLRVDRGTPVWLAAMPPGGRSGTAVVAERGIVAARYRPERDAVAVELILDDPGAHPFQPFRRCATAYTHPTAVVGAPPAHERRAADRLTRLAGELVHAEVALYPVPAAPHFAPLIVERWPAGARAAVAFADHADRTDPLALAALLHGVSDPRAPEHGRGGFLGHGLKLTKTFFVAPGPGTLAEPETRALADQLAAAGSEVALHSITPGRDDRAAVVSGLEAARRWSVVTWIDHQPQTNCEALSSRGWTEDPAFGIRDQLIRGGIRWAWSGSDVRSPGRLLQNLFMPESPRAAVPPLYPFPHDRRLWTFPSAWFVASPERLAATLAEPALDRLEQERGLFIAHSYLSASLRTTRRSDLRQQVVVVPRPDGSLALHPAFDAALARLGARVRRGDIASMTVQELGTRLRALSHVIVRYQPDGTAVVSNPGPLPIAALTVAVPTTGVMSVEGGRLLGRRREAGRTTIWFDLPAGGEVLVRRNPEPALHLGVR
jgi:hypothetical protein